MTDEIQIGRSAYLVSRGEDARVRKYAPPVGGIMNMLSRKLFGTSLPFANERRVNRILMDEEFKYFVHPGLTIFDQPEMLEFEYLVGEDVSKLDADQLSLALAGLLEFSSLGDRYVAVGLEGFVLRLLESPGIRTGRMIIGSDTALRNKIRGLWLVVKYYFAQPSIGPVLIHNDLMFSNIRHGPNGDIVFLDFEDAHTERKWILVDAIDLVFDKSSGTLNVRLLEEYWRSLSAKIGEEFEKLKLKQQIRVCLLRLSITGRRRTASTGQERCMMERIFMITLNDELYQNWWSTQLGNS